MTCPPVPAQVRAVQAYLEHVLQSTDQKLLVFAHHRDLLDGIEFAMNKCARTPPKALNPH